MNYSQLKNTVFLQFIFKIIIYKELCVKSYLFLGDIFKLYDELDQSVDEKHPKKDILNLCDKYDTFHVSFNQQNISTCKKLLRNLFLCNNPSSGNFTNCCSNIYVWLYFDIKKSTITDQIIKKIFELPNSKESDGRRNNYCPYFSFNDKIRNPEKLMGLRIFNDNIHTIQSMLKGVINPDICSLIRYIYNCIRIYRDMNSRYCSNGDDKKEENQNSCDIIHKFKNFYTPFISNRDDLTHKFPELTSDIPLNDIVGCSLKGINSDEFSDETQLGTSITKGVSTAVGAMVGIPPFWALIYKFTPFGQFIRSRYNNGITNNIGENELFYPTTENMNNNSDNTRYNVIYGPVSN